MLKDVPAAVFILFGLFHPSAFGSSGATSNTVYGTVVSPAPPSQQELQQALPLALQQALPLALQQVLPLALQQVLPLAIQPILRQALQQVLPLALQQTLPQALQQALPQTTLPQAHKQEYPQTTPQAFPLASPPPPPASPFKPPRQTPPQAILQVLPQTPLQRTPQASLQMPQQAPPPTFDLPSQQELFLGNLPRQSCRQKPPLSPQWDVHPCASTNEKEDDRAAQPGRGTKARLPPSIKKTPPSKKRHLSPRCWFPRHGNVIQVNTITFSQRRDQMQYHYALLRNAKPNRLSSGFYASNKNMGYVIAPDRIILADTLRNGSDDKAMEVEMMSPDSTEDILETIEASDGLVAKIMRIAEGGHQLVFQTIGSPLVTAFLFRPDGDHYSLQGGTFGENCSTINLTSVDILIVVESSVAELLIADTTILKTDYSLETIMASILELDPKQRFIFVSHIG